MDDHSTNDSTQVLTTPNKKVKRKEPKLEHKPLGNLWWFKLCVSITASLLAFRAAIMKSLIA